MRYPFAYFVHHTFAAKVIIDEKDLDEKFVRGGGNGGQSINKTKSCVQLVHIPTGIIVHCQQNRDLTSNRKVARRILQEKLDFQVNGEDSKKGRRIARLRRRKYNAARRTSRQIASARDEPGSDIRCVEVDMEDIEVEDDLEETEEGEGLNEDEQCRGRD